jgi:hypothetical protein
MELSTLNKGDWVRIDNGLGAPVRAKLLESPKQGRGFKTVILMDVQGQDAGLFNEAGGVYARDILEKIDAQEN